MSSTISRRVAPLGLGILTFGVLAAALVSAPAGARAHATTAHATTGDRTMVLTLKCAGHSCSGSWAFFQGGFGGRLVGSGSIGPGAAGTTTREMTIQPAAADTAQFSVSDDTTSGCGQSMNEFFTPGSSIHFKVTVPPKQPNGILCAGAGSTFSGHS